jgi:hypothetical protein
VILALVIVLLSFLTGISLSGAVFFMPLAAILMLLLDVIIVEEFRYMLSGMMAEKPQPEVCNPGQTADPEPAEGFRSVIMVADHYPDIISGRYDYLLLHAGDAYATELIAIAARTFDPGFASRAEGYCFGQSFQ